MFSLPGQAKPIMLSVKLQDNLIQMELDTGAALSIIGEATYQEIFGKDISWTQPTPDTLYGVKLLKSPKSQIRRSASGLKNLAKLS